jgi:hypothetical protein
MAVNEKSRLHVQPAFLFGVCYSLFAIRCSLFAVRCSLFAVRFLNSFVNRKLKKKQVNERLFIYDY